MKNAQKQKWYDIQMSSSAMKALTNTLLDENMRTSLCIPYIIGDRALIL